MVYKYKLLNSKAHKTKRRQLRQNSTRSEDLVWMLLGNNRLGYKFRRQYGIGGFVVDFCCPSLKLIVEIDGETHHGEQIYEEDLKRQKYLESLGFSIRRYPGDYVLDNLDGVFNDLKSICGKFSSTKPSPYPLP